MARNRLLLYVILMTLTVILVGCGRPGGAPPGFAPDQAGPEAPPATAEPPAEPLIVPPGSVTIKILPPLLTLRGDEVSFQGRAEIDQKLAARTAAEIVVVAFRASGENAHKSAIRIVWGDGAVETIPVGAQNLVLSPQRRAKKITILGYSFHEQRVFRDVAKKGTLSWEIRYAPAE